MLANPSEWNFNIDKYLNPWMPEPRLGSLPRPLSHFLGYRHGPQRRLGNIVITFWAFIGAFVSLVVIEAVGRQVPTFQDHGAPIIIGSFGAAAVLEFYAIESPLAQPRNAVLSQVIASITGVAIRRLFELGIQSQEMIWLGGALSCACTTALMALTGTVHPPAGATALLAVVDDQVAQMGWLLLPVMLLGCALMQCVALLLNNIQRRFPNYWWTPEEVGQRWRRQGILKGDEEAATADGASDTSTKLGETCTSHHLEDGPSANSGSSQILVARGMLYIPEGLYISPVERSILEELQNRLQP